MKEPPKVSFCWNIRYCPICRTLVDGKTDRRARGTNGERWLSKRRNAMPEAITARAAVCVKHCNSTAPAVMTTVTSAERDAKMECDGGPSTGRLRCGRATRRPLIISRSRTMRTYVYVWSNSCCVARDWTKCWKRRDATSRMTWTKADRTSGRRGAAFEGKLHLGNHASLTDATS